MPTFKSIMKSMFLNPSMTLKWRDIQHYAIQMRGWSTTVSGCVTLIKGYNIALEAVV